MGKRDLWSGKQQQTKGKKAEHAYEGNAERLLDYAEAHSSARSLQQVKVKAELRRMNIERRSPTLEEIQQRYNFTQEAAQRLLRAIDRAVRPATKKADRKEQVPPVKSTVLEKNAAEADAGPATTVAVQLKVILEDIRRRFGEEIRIRGEQTSAKEGFVYLVTHPCFVGWVKGGMTIDYEMRLSMYNTADPLSRFAYASLLWTGNRRSAEKALLAELQDVAEETKSEWFRISIPKALLVFDGLTKKI